MSKKGKLAAETYKGVRDFYPEDQALLNYIIATQRRVAERFGYVEYHASVLESAELYRAKGAVNEEIVNEQAYTFLDRGQREVTLRPEMTPTVARMLAARRRELVFPLRWYSVPNLFRYERPQRGRLREHWQLNVDLFGSHSSAADVEIILVAYELMRAFGALESDFVIKLGSRAYLDALVKRLELDEAGGKKLRAMLDRREKMPPGEFEREIRDLGAAAELLAEEPPKDVVEVLKLLKDAGVGNAVFAPEIVRGFDYYTGVVFEIFDTHPENNRSLVGGGRYDNLLELFGSEKVPAVGFGMGDPGIANFMEVRGLKPEYAPPTKVYLAVVSPDLVGPALELAGALRKEGVPVAVDFGEKKLGDQIKTASKHKVPYLVVVGKDEVASGKFVVRDLDTGKEEPRSREELASFFLTL